MSSQLEMLKRLTDAYRKEANGNIGKLFKIIGAELDAIEQTTQAIKTVRDVDSATDYSLDRIGNNVQQLRGQTTDYIYRILIKSKIQRNLSDGGIETLIGIISYLLDIPKTEVEIIETWSTESASFQLNVPADAVNSIGLTLSQMGQIVDIVSAAGVKAASLFEGTFALSSLPDTLETDVNTGFANDAQTTGGTLGAYYDPGSDIPLPL